MHSRTDTALWMLAALVLAFAPAGCAEDKPETKGAPGADAKIGSFKRVTADEVAAKIEEARAGKIKLYIFDNNNKEQHARARLPGAKWVKFDEVKASDLPADKDATLIFYCGSERCTASHTGALSAVKLGYKNVYIMPEGIQGWQKANKPVENS